MFRTLEAFQAEWFEKKCTQEENIGITNEESSIVPNVYAKNELLNDKVVNLTRQAEKTKSDYNKLKEEYDKLGKERDFHRMHHRRITQEKDKLLNDIKRQSLHYKNYEPTLKELRKKYEIAMKEKMLSNLERDRAVAHFNAISDREKFRDAKGNVVVGDGEASTMLGTGFREDRETGKIGPTQHNLMVERNAVQESKMLEKKKYQESEIEGNWGSKHPKVSLKGKIIFVFIWAFGKLCFTCLIFYFGSGKLGFSSLVATRLVRRHGFIHFLRNSDFVYSTPAILK